MKVIIPGGAGSGPDTLARLLISKLADLWGQAVVAENIVGAGGNIGHERGAKSPPDGHTLLLGMVGPMSINPTLQEGKLGFDPVKDLVPITMVSRYPNLLVVHPGVQARNLQELTGLARANPGKLRYGTPGSGTTPHLSAVMFSIMAGVRMLEVPYKSSAQMTTDVLAGHIDLMFLNPGAVLQHVKAGTLRAVAITSPTRQPYAPDVPTLIESGLPGYEVSSWFGMFAPAGTPPALVARLNADLLKVMALPDVREQFAARGDEAFGGTPEQAGSYLRAEIAKWQRVIRQANIKAD
ncbi:MAG: tripartite tricarboxylate transporter substrate binding protein [Burkholderiales bacterium]|nr:tripartite tricarboxylate transporter substrate binding protein [Burkholderiales bacterium]